jgi:type III pantothenate kinase
MTPPILAVDIGNTRIQLGRTTRLAGDGHPEWDRMQFRDTVSFQPESLEAELPSEPLVWRVASVQRSAERLLAEWVTRARPSDRYQRLSHADLPLRIDVQQPGRVGMDRLVAAVAANRLRQPPRAAIVIDAGTAVTVDALAFDGTFLGGVILPGMRMTVRALAAGTDLLPLVDVAFSDAVPPVIGRSTEAAIRSGAFWGTVGGIRHFVARFADEIGHDAEVFVTGGDAGYLAQLIGSGARCEPYLVLNGIVWSGL